MSNNNTFVSNDYRFHTVTIRDTFTQCNATLPVEVKPGPRTILFILI